MSAMVGSAPERSKPGTQVTHQAGTWARTWTFAVRATVPELAKGQIYLDAKSDGHDEGKEGNCPGEPKDCGRLT